MKLHILSDLHLNVADFAAPATDADVVILAGDIARPAKASAWAKALGKPVVYVPGNHEFYGGSIDGTVRELREACAGSNVHVLNRDAVVLDGVRFLGAVLWTDFAIFTDPETRARAIAEAQSVVLDFTRIRADSLCERPFSPEDSAVLFRDAAQWLDARLSEPFDGPTVVVTHHAPSLRSVHPRFEGSLLNACFVSDAEHLLAGARADLWIHGHLHDSFDYVAQGTRVLCNPRGYAKGGVNENEAFDPGFTVSVSKA
jgi:predicted phosphodiesterase